MPPSLYILSPLPRPTFRPALGLVVRLGSGGLFRFGLVDFVSRRMIRDGPNGSSRQLGDEREACEGFSRFIIPVTTIPIVHQAHCRYHDET